MWYLIVSIPDLCNLITSNGQLYKKKIETLSPNLLSFVVARMCSTIDSSGKGYKLPEQILFNFLALFPTLYIS